MSFEDSWDDIAAAPAYSSDDEERILGAVAATPIFSDEESSHSSWEEVQAAPIVEDEPDIHDASLEEVGHGQLSAERLAGPKRIMGSDCARGTCGR